MLQTTGHLLVIRKKIKFIKRKKVKIKIRLLKLKS